MADVFISYSRDDQDFMLALRDNLLALGFNVWVDVDGLTVGTSNWAEAIDAAIQHVNAVVVILSPSARESEWVNKEIIRAQTFGKPIFPVLIAGDVLNAVPFTLTGVQFANMRADVDREAGFRALVAHLGERVGWDIPPFQLASDPDHAWGIVHTEGQAPGKTIAIGQDLPESIVERAQQERRLEAAMPHRTRIGSRTECRVKISLPDSKGLRGELPAVTLAGDLIRKGDVSGSTFPCVFPVDERTGRLLPATLCVKVTSADFAVRGETRMNRRCSIDEVELSLPPDHDSGTVVFELVPSENGQQAGRSRVIVTVSDGEQVLAQTVVVTELVHEVDPIKEIAWNLVSQLMLATSAPLAANSSTINISVDGSVSGEMNVAGRDVSIDREVSRKRDTDLLDLDGFGEAKSPSTPPAEHVQPARSAFPAQASRKSSQGWTWLLIVLIVVVLIVLIVLAINGGWFGG
jgi:hypothetical protein